MVLIAGPTASGKSALALTLAEEAGGVVVNADSMQVYADLRILTARPAPEDEQRAPHRLYGHVDAAQTYSAGRWLSDLVAVLAELQREGRPAVIVGGTGLYFKVLLRGLAPVPPVPEEVRTRIRAQVAELGAPALHTRLAARDPESAQRLRPNDRTRIARALEIVEATGRTVGEWHREAQPPLIDADHVTAVFLAPARAELARRINARFDAMLEQGAEAEMRALAQRGLDPSLPAMKAHGMPWFMKHFAGALSREEAVREAKRDTRHYAKRQETWFRNQLPEFAWVSPDGAAAHVRARLG